MEDLAPQSQPYVRLRKPPAAEARQRKPRKTRNRNRTFYLGVRGKFLVAAFGSFAWFAVCAWLAVPWMRDLARLTDWAVSLLIIGGIALVPGRDERVPGDRAHPRRQAAAR
jgi:hypothetical protein